MDDEGLLRNIVYHQVRGHHAQTRDCRKDEGVIFARSGLYRIGCSWIKAEPRINQHIGQARLELEDVGWDQTCVALPPAATPPGGLRHLLRRAQRPSRE
jgi:hypothetical protein